ncbi:type VII secretion target [Kitasatospora sp. NPDC088134]|uniref:type VII secretion target n=1 Tax=Kitasatospora sp. NPDC088134 TaxID=3364071 RepID=UPI003805FB1D
MAAPDFDVDHEALEECAKRLDRAGEDLEAVAGRFREAPHFDRDYFGDYGVPEAAAGFFARWQDERRLDIEALRELAGKVRQSAANYRDTDAAVAAAVGGRPG